MLGQFMVTTGLLLSQHDGWERLPNDVGICVYLNRVVRRKQVTTCVTAQI